MKKLRALWMRLRGVTRAQQEQAEFDAELDSHVAMHTEDGVRAGLTEAEARRRALIRLGGAEQTRQAHRERRTLPWLETLLRDITYAARTLGKHPGVTAAAVLSIGLGIGANATIFSMVSRFVLRPAPMGDPTTLLSIYMVPRGEPCCNSFSLPLYNDLRDQAQSFSGVAAFNEEIPASISGSGEPERVWGQAVTPNFFDVLGLRMELGRGFVSGEDRVPEVVLGGGLWQRQFNGDRNIVGKSITISGANYTVIGVAPAAFHSVEQVLVNEFWVPLGMVQSLVPNAPPAGSREYHWLPVVARLKPGVTRAQAGAELNTLALRFGENYPATDKDLSFVFWQAGTLPPREKSATLIFLGALSVVALLVLSIAGVNVANLLFAQAACRQRDMAVRLALGATRGRLQRQMLVESLLLSLAGGALGVLLSFGATHALSALHVPAPVPLNVSIAVDWRTLLYSFGLSLLSGMLLGAAPAFAATRPRLASALRGEVAMALPGRRFSVRNLLVVVQIAMAVALLCITGLFLRSLQSAASIDIGFRSKNLLMMSVDPRVHGYTPERTVEFLTQLERRVAALPGVQSAIATDMPPLNGGHRSDGFAVVGHEAKDNDITYAELYMVTPGSFDTLGIPLLAGTDFGAETVTGPHTAIVNRAFADRVFPGANPIGQRVSGGGVTYQIVGVCGNVKSRTLGEDERAVLYRSLKQTVAGDPSLMGYTLVVHTAGDPGALTEAVRRQIHALDPAMAIFNEETMEEHVRTAYFLPRLAAMLFGVFGFIGLVLAVVGLYGVMSYAVSRRTREIGIRMALGAESGAVQRLVVRQGMVLALIAVALGWPAAWMLARVASSFLYGIQPHDALTFAAVPPVMAAIALVACWIPARRASRVDPMQALRTE